MKKQTETIKFCIACKCKTWHIDDICEWVDSHKVPIADSHLQSEKK